MRSTFKLLFYVKRNVPKSDNSLPLMGRITINKGIVQFSLKMSVPPELWDSKAGWKSHSTLTLLATQNYPFWLKYD